MIFFHTVLYVTLINLAENGMHSSTVTEELSIPSFMSFKNFNFGQIKIIFCRDKNFKYMLFQKCKCV